MREFYANLKSVKLTKCDPHIIIRGTVVKFGAKVINAHYGLPNHPLEAMEAKDVCGNWSWLCVETDSKKPEEKDHLG